jgi:glutamate decarboxylase
LRNGYEGYRLIQQACLDHGIFIAEEIEKMGMFDLLYDGRSALPGAAWMLKKDAGANFNLYDLSDKLRVRGWQIASYSLPSNCRDMVIQRVVIRHGFSHDMAQLLIDDIKRSIRQLNDHPAQSGLAEEEAGGFKH